MSRSLHLAFDLGAESGRAVLGVLDDGVLREELLHRFTTPLVQSSEKLSWDFDRISAELRHGLELARARASELGGTLQTIGVDSWGVDFGLVNAEGRLLASPRAYRDPRNLPVFERCVERLGAERLYRATGNQLMPLNTLFQLLAIAEEEPEILARAERLLFMPDLCHSFLCSSRSVERSIASTSQMLKAGSADWDFDLLRDCGLQAPFLGEVVSAGTELGETEQGERVVAPGGHDTASAVAAIPSLGAGSAYLSSGTWSLLGCLLDAPCLTDEAREAPFTNEQSIDGRVRFLQNMTGLWILQELRRELAGAGEAWTYAELAEAARAAKADPSGFVFDPADARFAQAGGMMQRLADYAKETGQPFPGASTREERAALFRAVLTSLALAYRRTFEKLEACTGRSFDRVHVVGGGCQNELLCQLTADALAKPVHAGPAEATAAGNLLCQALGVGILRDTAEIREVSAASYFAVNYEPDPEDRHALPWERFLSLKSLEG